MLRPRTQIAFDVRNRTVDVGSMIWADRQCREQPMVGVVIEAELVAAPAGAFRNHLLLALTITTGPQASQLHGFALPGRPSVRAVLIQLIL